MNFLQLHRVDVYPPTNGGEKRVWETAKKLAEYGDVRLACPWPDLPNFPVPGIEPGMLDTALLHNKFGRIHLWNLCFLYSSGNPYVDLLTNRILADTPFDPRIDVVVCESPQMFVAAKRISVETGAYLLTNKHNAMFSIADDVLKSKPVPARVRRRLIANLRTFEQRTIDQSDCVVFQSEDDLAEFDVPETTRVDVIPNGTDYERIQEGGDPSGLRREWGIEETDTVCLFIGSYDYTPNREAASIIVNQFAPAFPDVQFVLAGRNPPEHNRENVHTPGFVDDLPGALHLADIALAPLVTGAGTKLKMLDYLAAGLPIVTTPTGAQGLPIEDGKTAIVRNGTDEMIEAIDLLVSDSDRRHQFSRRARQTAMDYSWQRLLDGYGDIIDEVGRTDRDTGVL